MKQRLKIPDPRLKDPEIQRHALCDQHLPIGQEFEISRAKFFRTFHFSHHIDPLHFLTHFWTIYCDLPDTPAI